MRFLRALGVAFTTAIMATLVVVVVSDPLTRLYHVPDMEGQRAVLIVFAIAPLTFIAAFIVGVIVAVIISKRGSYLKAQGLSLALVLLIIALVSAVLYLAADKPPKIDGKVLTLEFEVRLPPAIQLPAEMTGYSVSVSLYSDGAQTRVTYIDPASIKKDATGATFSGELPISSHATKRQLAPSIGNVEHGTQFIPLNLPAAPGTENEAWSDWSFATEYADSTPANGPDRMSARYRVQQLEP